MNPGAIDLPTFEALQQTAGVEFVKELVDTFLEEAPSMLSEMRDALTDGNADRFRRSAHSLKSNSLTFGAVKLGALARDLELGGLDAARKAGTQPLDALTREYAQVAAALTVLRNA
jgi:HPt (histidine-containing phosphotransfer) domain-containing protein